MEIKNSADLQEAIVQLEAKNLREKLQLKENFHELTESLKPINLIKSTFNKVKESPGITGNILKATVGLGIGLLSKRLLIGKSTNIAKTFLGSVIKMGVAGLVAKNSDNIKASGSRFIKNIFNAKKQDR